MPYFRFIMKISLPRDDLNANHDDEETGETRKEKKVIENERFPSRCYTG